MNNFDQFWQCYPGKKVAKPKCKEKYDKLSDEDHKEVMLGIQAQIRYRAEAKKSGEFIPEWCNSQTFINQQRWYDEIGSHAELKEKVAAAECCVPGCSAPVHAPNGEADKQGGRACFHHLVFTPKGKLRAKKSEKDRELGVSNVVDLLREHYKEHPEIHELRGKAAIKFMKYAIGKMNIVGDR